MCTTYRIDVTAIFIGVTDVVICTTYRIGVTAIFMLLYVPLII